MALSMTWVENKSYRGWKKMVAGTVYDVGPSTYHLVCAQAD